MTTPSSPSPEPQEEQTPSPSVETPTTPAAQAAKAPLRAPAQPYINQAAQSSVGTQQPFHTSSFSPQQLGVDLSKKSKTTMVTIGNFSLFAIVLNLVLLGGFTFLGGFLVGLWVGGPGPYGYGGHSLASQTYPTVMSAPPVAPQTQTSPVHVEPTTQTQSSELASKAGEAASGAVSEFSPHNLPAFLEPLVKDVQGVVQKEAAQKAQKAVEHLVGSSSQHAVSGGSSTSSSDSHHPESAPSASHSSAPSASPHSSLSPSKSKKEAYAVQLGVFASHENARDLQKRLQGLNYRTQVKATSVANEEGVAYEVHSGHYDTHDNAMHAAAQFKADVPGATVVRLPEDDHSGS